MNLFQNFNRIFALSDDDLPDPLWERLEQPVGHDALLEGGGPNLSHGRIGPRNADTRTRLAAVTLQPRR